MLKKGLFLGGGCLSDSSRFWQEILKMDINKISPLKINM